MSDNQKRDDDEDLMSDFKDLFPEDEDLDEPAGSEDSEASAGAGEALDELDAFLDDFEKGFNAVEEQPPGGADESAQTAVEDSGVPELTEALSETEHAAASGRDSSGELELGKDELDLAMSRADDSEVFDDSWGEVEPEEAGDTETPTAVPLQSEDEAESRPEEEMTQTEEDPLAEVAALAANTPVASAKQSAMSTGGGSRAMLWSMITVMLVALALAATGAWLAFSNASEVDQLNRKLQQLQQQRAGTGNRAPAISAMRTEIRTLGARVNELAVVVEGPMSHLRQSNEETLSDIEKRLSRLEAATTAKPLVQKSTAAKPAARSTKTSKPAAPVKKGGWVINLVSLSDEKDADAELKHLRSLGVRAEKQRAVSGGKVWYRLRVPGFTSYEGAKAYIDTIEKKTGVKNAWVARE